MRPSDVIIKKRDGGGELDEATIRHFVCDYVEGESTDYHLAAFLMAVFFKGMTPRETAALTRAMMESGDTYDWDAVAAARGAGRPADKHSTGGVGDKASLPLAPLAAACGLVVPMVSGRGLGHTGGTLDKLESIPGFRVTVERDQFEQQLRAIGVVMAGQSDNFVPADKKLYALRDVTGTVESVPLICASILSKKAAAGVRALVMDVKTGNGAFMPTIERSRELAKAITETGATLGMSVRALITDMSQPLGRMIGNAVEVRESVDCLRGGGPKDLRDLTVELCAEMMVLAAGRPPQHAYIADAQTLAERALDRGEAYEVFLKMVEMQGGDPRVFDKPDGLPVAPDEAVLKADRAGFLAEVQCREVGVAAMLLGAGRQQTTDTVDRAVGMEMLVRLGDPIEAGQPLMRVFHRAGHGLDECVAKVTAALKIADEAPEIPPLIHERL